MNANDADATHTAHPNDWHEDDLLTTTEVARRVGVKVRAVQTWIAEGYVEAQRERVRGRRRYLVRWGDARAHAESIGPALVPAVIAQTPTTQTTQALQNGHALAVIENLQRANLSLTQTTTQQQATIQAQAQQITTLAQTVQAQQAEIAQATQRVHEAQTGLRELDIKAGEAERRAAAAEARAGERRGWLARARGALRR